MNSIKKVIIFIPVLINHDYTVRYYSWSPDGRKVVCLREASISKLTSGTWHSGNYSIIQRTRKLYFIDVQTKTLLKTLTVSDLKNNISPKNRPMNIAWCADGIYLDSAVIMKNRDALVTLHVYNYDTLEKKDACQWESSGRWWWDMNKSGKNLVYVIEDSNMDAIMYLKTGNTLKKLITNRSANLNYSGIQMLGWSTVFPKLIYFGEYSSTHASNYINPDNKSIFDAKTYCRNNQKNEVDRKYSPVNPDFYLIRRGKTINKEEFPENVYQLTRFDLILHDTKHQTAVNLTEAIQ